uniref:Uncharacterized protein n=1 Tax=Heterorhabditis bacteriophora TaxID=37862 RepID=A0A1I7WBM4_HETBA
MRQRREEEEIIQQKKEEDRIRQRREEEDRIRQRKEEEDRIRQRKEEEDRIRQRKEDEEKIRQKREEEERIRQKREEEERIRQKKEEEDERIRKKNEKEEAMTRLNISSNKELHNRHLENVSMNVSNSCVYNPLYIMTFYFALLNVSSKREERSPHKARRRRHSIASVESPLLDYRLLPRPQVVRNEFFQDTDVASHSNQLTDIDVPSSSFNCDRSADHRVSTSSKQCSHFICLKQHRHDSSLSRVTSNHTTSTTKGQQKHCQRNDTLTNDIQLKGRNGVMKKSESSYIAPTLRGRKVLRENMDTKLNLENQRIKTIEEKEKQIEERMNSLQVASSSTQHPKAVRSRLVNSKGGKPLVIKRKVSQESITSDSRRSSKGSNNSPTRKDSAGKLRGPV